MRTIAMLGILLLAGCASNRLVNGDTPLCPSGGPDGSLTAVRIEINAAAKTVNPKDCYVYEGTEVGWWEANGKAFEADFTEASPTSWGKMHFPSKPVGSHHEASFEAKKVKSQTKFKYDAKAGGVTLDPVIIVDPH